MDAVRLAVGPHAILHRALEDVVVVQQPLQEGAAGFHLGGLAAAAGQARADLPHRAHHLREVLHRGEHALEHREDLVLDVAEALLGVDALDLEVAVTLLGAFFLRPADPDDALPLAAHGEDGVHRAEDAQARLAEVVLEALEDEGRVGGVGLDDRDLLGQAVAAALLHPGGGIGVARGDVDARQPAVDLEGRRHLAHHEAELLVGAGGQGLGGEAQGDAVGRLRQHDRRKGQRQIAVLGGRLLGPGSPGPAPLCGRVLRGRTVIIAADHIPTPSLLESHAVRGIRQAKEEDNGDRAVRSQVSRKPAPRGGVAGDAGRPGPRSLVRPGPERRQVLAPPRGGGGGPDGIAIRDTGSANGVYVNGKKVERASLQPGDVVGIGDVTLTVLAEEMPGTLVMGPDEAGLLEPESTTMIPAGALGAAHRPARARRPPHASDAPPNPREGARAARTSARLSRRAAGPRAVPGHATAARRHVARPRPPSPRSLRPRPAGRSRCRSWPRCGR